MDLAAFAGLVGITGVGAVGLVGTLRRIWAKTPSEEKGLLALVRLYLKGRIDSNLELEHRATVVALLSALRPGGQIIDQRADGGKLTIKLECDDHCRPALEARRSMPTGSPETPKSGA